MKGMVERCTKRVKRIWARRSIHALYFVPGAFLVMLAFAMMAAPKLFIFLIAGFFLCSGVLLSYAAWRFVTLKKRVETIFKDLSGRIVIHGLEIQDPFDFEQHSAEGKKIVYH